MFDVPMRLYSILLVFHPGRPLNGNQHIMFDVPMWLYSIIVGFSPRPPAAGIDAATPQGPKRLPVLARQSDARSYCRACTGPLWTAE
jgi:hypothetical protein